ncbi:MAG: hypothetical protein WAN23_15625 [Candidatus Acidiferrales bacterium]
MDRLAMHTLAVQIVRFVDAHQPGFVACEFVDAEGSRHTLIDKVPIFSAERLDSSSKYPQPGFAACTILNSWRDERGRDLVRISTARPGDIESTEGLSEFVVLPSQVSTGP